MANNDAVAVPVISPNVTVEAPFKANKAVETPTKEDKVIAEAPVLGPPETEETPVIVTLPRVNAD